MWRTGAILGCLALAACGPLPDPVLPEPVPDACGAAALQGLVGADGQRLSTMKFGVPVRIIRPGMAVTMDFSPSRLNIEIDAKDRISRVSCG